VENRQLQENSVIRLLHHNLVEFEVNTKIMSVIQLELVSSDVVQRLGHPVRLRFGDPVVQPSSDEDTADNFHGGTRDADQDEALHGADQDEATDDADYVQSGEDIGISLGDITTFSELRETITTFAASNNFLVNVHSDSAQKYKGRTRIRFLCKASGRQRKQKTDDATEQRRRKRDSLRTNCLWHITGYVPVTPALPDSPIEVTSMKLQHNCKPCIEKVVEIAQRSTSSGKIPMDILASMHALVRYGVDTRRIRMFIIDNKLDLRTDAKSIANLRLLVGRSFKDGKLQQCTVLSLQRPIESLCKKDEITSLFADLLKREIPETNRIRNALDVARHRIEGFDYRIRVGNDNELLSCIWQTGRMRARLRMYGQLLHLDGKAKANVEEWPLYLPTIIDGEGKLRRVAVAVSYVEDGNALSFILCALRSLTPGWTTAPTIQKDSKIGPEFILKEIPLANVQVYTFFCFTYSQSDQY
jgi:hypothetical protein